MEKVSEGFMCITGSVEKFGDYILIGEKDLDRIRDIKEDLEFSLDRAIKSNGYEKKTAFTLSLQEYPEDQKYSISVTCFAKRVKS